MQYRRLKTSGMTYFFTVVTSRRRKILWEKMGSVGKNGVRKKWGQGKNGVRKNGVRSCINVFALPARLICKKQDLTPFRDPFSAGEVEKNYVGKSLRINKSTLTCDFVVLRP